MGYWLVGCGWWVASLFVCLFFFFSEVVADCVGLLGREERKLSLVVARGGSYWLNHEVLATAVVLVACVEL